VKSGSRSWTRTNDPLINSQLLYQLSYPGTAVATRLGDRRPFVPEAREPAAALRVSRLDEDSGGRESNGAGAMRSL